MLCDLSDIGKSYIAKHYAKTHKNVCYVDCSQVKSRSKLVRFIAKEFGVESGGRYSDVYADLVFYLKTLSTPLIILDEAGDLEYSAFLELKALWNATELSCGWYMMGADGLGDKIRRAITAKKVGYAEIFSRYGRRYLAVVPFGSDEKLKLLMKNAIQIAEANKRESMTQEDVRKLVLSTLDENKIPSLRRIYKELSKVG
jgi:Cdc6-like AAA superfamily ATPase